MQLNCVRCSEKYLDLESFAKHLLNEHFCYDCAADFSTERTFWLHCLAKHEGNKAPATKQMIDQLARVMDDFLSSLNAELNQTFKNRKKYKKFLSKIWAKFIERTMLRNTAPPNLANSQSESGISNTFISSGSVSTISNETSESSNNVIPENNNFQNNAPVSNHAIIPAVSSSRQQSWSAIVKSEPADDLPNNSADSVQIINSAARPTVQILSTSNSICLNTTDNSPEISTGQNNTSTNFDNNVANMEVNPEGSLFERFNLEPVNQNETEKIAISDTISKRNLRNSRKPYYGNVKTIAYQSVPKFKRFTQSANSVDKKPRRRIQCQFCGEMYDLLWKTNLRYHASKHVQQVAQVDYLYACNLCDLSVPYQTNSLISLQRHVFQKHKINFCELVKNVHYTEVDSAYEITSRTLKMCFPTLTLGTVAKRRRPIGRKLNLPNLASANCKKSAGKSWTIGTTSAEYIHVMPSNEGGVSGNSYPALTRRPNDCANEQTLRLPGPSSRSSNFFLQNVDNNGSQASWTSAEYIHAMPSSNEVTPTKPASLFGEMSYETSAVSSCSKVYDESDDAEASAESYSKMVNESVVRKTPAAKTSQCQLCGLVLLSDLSTVKGTHVTKHLRENSTLSWIYRCGICGFHSFHVVSLRRHMITKHEISQGKMERNVNYFVHEGAEELIADTRALCFPY